MLAEAIADLWCVPYQRPDFAKKAIAEHRRLVQEGDYAPPPRPVKPFTVDEVGDPPMGIIDPRDKSQGGPGW